MSKIIELLNSPKMSLICFFINCMLALIAIGSIKVMFSFGSLVTLILSCTFGSICLKNYLDNRNK